MIMQDYETSTEKSLSLNEALLVPQNRVIRLLASKNFCVIMGRCTDYILCDIPIGIHIFLHAGMKHKIERVVNEYGLGYLRN